MTDKFRVPKVTMLTGLILWVSSFTWYVTLGASYSWSPQLAGYLSVIAGGVIVISGFT